MSKGRPTINDVAGRAGVTGMTVSRVLNGSKRVRPETRATILQAIEELGYVPNGLARGLLTGRTLTLGLLVGDLGNPYWTALAKGAVEASQDAGYSVVVGDLAYYGGRNDLLVDTMLRQRVDGLIINPSDGKALRKLVPADFPFVVIGYDEPGLRADIVRGDVHSGALRLAQYLLSLGHRRIALLNGPVKEFESKRRLRGYLAALDGAGLDPRKAMIRNASYGYMDGLPAARELLSLPKEIRPEAILASNNYLGLSVIVAARELGITIPNQLALACFDDFVLAALIDPFLTVMSQPARDLGWQAAQMLLRRLASPSTWKPRKVIYEPELIVRRSCGAGLSRLPAEPMIPAPGTTKGTRSSLARQGAAL